MTIRMIDHINIDTHDLDRTVRFFTEVLGLAQGPRPSFSFPGAWLYAGDAAVVHLNHLTGAAATARAKRPPKNTGAFNHFSFAATDFDGHTARLKRLGVDYETRDVPGRNLRQIFCFDPNGVRIELTFTVTQKQGARAKVYEPA
jgi:catechol 2,3-dioxygenase-like lactoylglutathione lyase family enzyme